MSLETATYINGLVISNPTGGDPKREGPAHLRLIKKTVKNCFPNVSATVHATQAELNAFKSGGSVSGNLAIKGDISASSYTAYKLSDLSLSTSGRMSLDITDEVLQVNTARIYPEHKYTKMYMSATSATIAVGSSIAVTVAVPVQLYSGADLSIANNRDFILDKYSRYCVSYRFDLSTSCSSSVKARVQVLSDTSNILKSNVNRYPEWIGRSTIAGKLDIYVSASGTTNVWTNITFGNSSHYKLMTGSVKGSVEVRKL